MMMSESANNREVQFIVTTLNQSPFNKGLTLVTFDKKSPGELAQILQDVVEEITTDQKVNLREETPEMTAQRIFDFLWVLKYKSSVNDPNTFKNGIATGDKSIVYPVLGWLLHRIPELRKRAYLAKYLLPMEVPGEMLNEEVYLEYKQQQQMFKEIHKTVERIRNSGFKPHEMKEEYASLTEQKERLNEKILRIKKKLERVPNLRELLIASEAIRKEQDEEHTLGDSIKEQQGKLNITDQKLQKAKEKLKELQHFKVEEGGFETKIKTMEEENKSNSYLVGSLSHDISEKKLWTEKLRKVLNEPTMSEQDRLKVQQQIQKLKEEIKKLSQKRDSTNKVDDKLSFYRQQYNSVAKKKNEKESSLKDLLSEKRVLEKELETKLEQLDEAHPGRMLRGEALDKYVQDLRKKTFLFKKYKAEQNTVRTEYGVLSRSKEILEQREITAKERLRGLEAERGVSGYESTQNKLEEISALKGEIDDTKGKTLEEISEVVTQINQTIKERKTKLAPLIRELQTLRKEYQEVEIDYTEKKAEYDSQTIGMQNEKERLTNEVTLFREEAQREESRYHYFHAAQLLLDAQLYKATNPLDDQGNSIKDKYTKATQEQEQLSKSLREQQKVIKETHEPNLAQMEMFSDLKKLLQFKLKLQAPLSENPLQVE